MSAHLVVKTNGEITFRCGRCGRVFSQGFLHPKGGIFCARCCQFGTEMTLFLQASLSRSLAQITVLESKLAQNRARSTRAMARRLRETRRRA